MRRAKNREDVVPLRESQSGYLSHRTASDRAAIIVWIAILVLTGTSFRLRPEDDATAVDWLVAAQVAASLVGGILGLTLIVRKGLSGLGQKTIIVYILAVGASAGFSSYRTLVTGYWMLLVGGSLLTIGLVQRARNEKDLCGLENAWLVTLCILLFKDSVMSWFVVEVPEAYATEPFRLGMNVIGATTMGLFAALAFVVGAKAKEVRYQRLLWVTRGLLLGILILSRTRTALLALLAVTLVRLCLGAGPKRMTVSRIAVGIFCLTVLIGLITLLAWSFELPFVTSAVQAFNRDEDIDTVMSVTGRVDIWQQAIERTFGDGPIPLVFGHGYGTTRYVLDERYSKRDFFAGHTHNTLLELLLSVGLLGTVPCLIFMIYGARWVTRWREAAKFFSMPFVLRAISVQLILLINSLTEVDVVAKLSPATIIYLFYIAVLDRANESVEAPEARLWTTKAVNSGKTTTKHAAAIHLRDGAKIT